MKSVTGGASFVYDGDGNRVMKTENGETILYVNQYYEKNITTGEVTTYYYLGGQLVAMRQGDDLEYIHQDHLSSTSVMTDDSGESLGAIKYLPFGECRNSPPYPTDILFTGQRLDDTGIYYYGARYYDATMGRFISADIFIPRPSDPQSFNRYSYCRNNPLKYIDPSGFTDVTAEIIYVPYWIQELLDENNLVIYRITNENGNSITVVVDKDQPQEVLDAAFEWGNQIRQEEGDYDLNIINLGDPCSDTDDFLDRFIFNDSFSHDIPTNWGQYKYWNPFNLDLGGSRWQLYWSAAFEAGYRPGPDSWDIVSIGTFIVSIATLPTPAAPVSVGLIVVSGVKIITAIFEKENPDIPGWLVTPEY